MSGVSVIRRFYMARFILRCITLAVCLFLCIMRPAQMKVIEGLEFFREFTILHIIWVVWMADMVMQLVPVRQKQSIGSQKYLGKWYEAPDGKYDRRGLKQYTAFSAKRAFVVFLIWTALIAALGVLHHKEIIGNAGLFMCTVIFYVCDLICVLFWCPFRLILGNRCCTTCRIFNWDHLMMFTPLMYIRGFFTWTLLGMAIIIWTAWEISVFLHPERFWEHSNEALKCANCTDKLCTQYCEKKSRRRCLPAKVSRSDAGRTE